MPLFDVAGTFTSWILTQEGWASGGRSSPMLELFQQLRTQLVDDNAVVAPRNFKSARDRSTPLAYSVDEAVASAHRTVGMLQSSLPTMAGFEVRFAAHSTEYFTQISGKTFPKALEYGNRIVLPRLAMEVGTARSPPQQLVLTMLGVVLRFSCGTIRISSFLAFWSSPRPITPGPS